MNKHRRTEAMKYPRASTITELMRDWNAPKYGVVGSVLPESREATVKLKNPNQQMVMVGTPLECCMLFMDAELVRINYKYPWWQRVLYTSWAGKHLFKAPDGKL